MEHKTKFDKGNTFIISIILLSSALILFFSTQKLNYHIDELLTYSLSNSTSNISFVPGEKYEPYAKQQEKFLATNNETRFNYKNVWKNQAEDVHPPLYYVLIHTISSFMHGEFSKYIGISVNIVFNALIILLLYKFSILLTKNKNIAYITSLFWAINPGIMSDMIFIRMYVMTMFFCLLIAYVHLKHFHNFTTKNFKLYLLLFLVSLAGFLTHYYFIVFTFFICALFVLVLLYRKQFRELLIYIGTYILTIVSALTIFPSIYYHIFGGGVRGEESMENFKNTEGYFQFVKYFWKLISNNIFGGYLSLFVLIITIGLIILMLRKKSTETKGFIENHSMSKIVFLIIASILYFLLISNIAVYASERYFQPIYPIVIVTFIPLLFEAVRKFFSKKVSFVIVCSIIVLIVINGYSKTTNFEYLKLDSEKALEVAEQYSDQNAIFIYNQVWKIPTNYVELANYKSVTFYNLNNLDPLYLNTNYNEFIVYSHTEDESIIKTIVDYLPNVETYKKLNDYGYCTVYYLE